MLYISEIFASIQGESTYAGIPTVFVRLSGCDMRCRWCDTSYAFSPGEMLSSEVIYDRVMAYNLHHVCITGGEPLLQPEIHTLMTMLCDAGLSLSLETNGAHSIADVDKRVAVILDIKCPGSGMAEKMYWENLSLIRPTTEIKFVIAQREDYEYALDVCRTHKLYEKVHAILFSPVNRDADACALASWIVADGIPARLNLQLHKYLWPETMRGV